MNSVFKMVGWCTNHTLLGDVHFLKIHCRVKFLKNVLILAYRIS